MRGEYFYVNFLAESSSSRRVVPGPTASGNLLDMQILGPHSISSESGILGVEPSNLCVNKPSR